ncbi:MAG: hypothetical protein ABIH86_04275 [Planctomycetota bacterium]
MTIVSSNNLGFRLALIAVSLTALASSTSLAIDEMNLDHLFGIPSQPETDDIFAGEPIDAIHAYNHRGVIEYSFLGQIRGLYGRRFGELHRIVNLEETFPTAIGVKFPVNDILEPEWGAVMVALLELKSPGGHTITVDLFSASFDDQTNKTLDASHYSVRYSYRLIEGAWGYLAPEIGYNVFEYTAAFDNWFEPDFFPPFISENTVPNPMIGASLRLRVGELGALVVGVRSNPCPLDWLDSNLTRMDARFDYLLLRFVSVSVGYDLYTIRFQDPDVGESATITQHGPFLSVDFFL